MPGTIACNMTLMLIKRKFPTTSIAGRFFNDFLKGRDLTALYAPLIIKANRDSNTTTFFLKENEVTLSIQYFNGYVLWVRCEIADPAVIAELNTFATKHMKPLRDEGDYRTYLYKYEWIFSICTFDVNEPYTHSYQLFTDGVQLVWPRCTAFEIFRYKVVNFVRNASRRVMH